MKFKFLIICQHKLYRLNNYVNISNAEISRYTSTFSLS